VATLHKSGKFPDYLFDGWMQALKQFYSSYKDPTPQEGDLRDVLDLNRIARNDNRPNQNWQNQPNQPQGNPNPSNNGNQNQGQYNRNNNASQNQGQYRNNYRPRARGYQRGYARGGRGRQNSSNYFNSY